MYRALPEGGLDERRAAILPWAKRTVDRSLTRQLLEHLGGTGESVTRFTDGDVQNELLNLELPHGVVCLLGRHCCGVGRRVG